MLSRSMADGLIRTDRQTDGHNSYISIARKYSGTTIHRNGPQP